MPGRPKNWGFQSPFTLAQLGARFLLPAGLGEEAVSLFCAGPSCAK